MDRLGREESRMTALGIHLPIGLVCTKALNMYSNVS